MLRGVDVDTGLTCQQEPLRECRAIDRGDRLCLTGDSRVEDRTDAGLADSVSPELSHARFHEESAGTAEPRLRRDDKGKGDALSSVIPGHRPFMEMFL